MQRTNKTHAARYSFLTAISIVIANMVGTGVFTSLGFQLEATPSGFPILLLWALGGIAAFCGAMSYAELGAALPRSGGEYNFLTRIYHPAAGFVSGWVSATIGFAAPSALAAITFAAYSVSVFTPDAPDIWRQVVAIALILVLTLIHTGRRKASGGLQVFFTGLKISVVIAFCLASAMIIDTPQPIALTPIAGDFGLISSGAFAVSLIYVSYGYAGWNAATYLSGETANPQKTLPWILGLGTLIVTVLYISLNAVFLKAAPAADMVGKVEIAFIAAKSIFGDVTANGFGIVMAALLISTVSAMTIAGPRVLQAIGEDFPLFRPFAACNRDGIPFRAIWLQSLVAIFFILTSSFESILVFAGFTVALNSFFAVIGLFVLRIREPSLHRPYRVLLFPLTPLVYLALTGWTLFFILLERPIEALSGLGIVAAGAVAYVFMRMFSDERTA